ncbi:HPP family protein, partial [Klebsiella variicola]
GEFEMTQIPSGATSNVAISRRAKIGQLMLAGLGAFLALASVSELTSVTGQPLLIGSFGATCVLLFGFPKGPFSRVRNVVGGHLLCSCVGLLCLTLLGPGNLQMAFAVGTCVALMLVTGTTHPPAGGNPIIIFMTQPGWIFALTPSLAGAALLVLIAAFYWRVIGASSTEREPS